MEKVKLGSLCLTKSDKTFDYNNAKCLIEKNTYVTICDNDNIEEGFVLVEIEGFDTVFDYQIQELTVIKK